MIQINDLRLKKFDALNWTIERKHITQDGTTTWATIGYYESLAEAARNLFIRSIPEPDSIPELIKNIEHAKQALTSALTQR